MKNKNNKGISGRGMSPLALKPKCVSWKSVFSSCSMTYNFSRPLGPFSLFLGPGYSTEKGKEREFTASQPFRSNPGSVT